MLKMLCGGSTTMFSYFYIPPQSMVELEGLKMEKQIME